MREKIEQTERNKIEQFASKQQKHCNQSKFYTYASPKQILQNVYQQSTNTINLYSAWEIYHS